MKQLNGLTGLEKSIYNDLAVLFILDTTQSRGALSVKVLEEKKERRKEKVPSPVLACASFEINETSKIGKSR